eukprot:TRINITY_DN6159_c0_g1_i1.p1 TRINITY_DN6159_c0_g1~~TRINITY_DN6159_c0_g1_i1.p1  ORF type:complete len:128 (-),score=41.59 TRINITY_DN6159_c0_g1_i1:155-538(-)
MNAPDPHATFLLEEGEKKVTIEHDTKISNAVTFTVQKEDHTLGNLVRMQLLQDKNILFAGYKIPHPLENYVIFKVQANENSTPVDAVQGALQDLQTELGHIRDAFQEQLDHQTHDQYGGAGMFGGLQ